MTTFFCDECGQAFHVADEGIVTSMVNWSLATGDGAVCPACDEGLYALRVDGLPVPLFSFEEEASCE